VARETVLRPEPALEFAAGIGTAHCGDRIEEVIRAADALMYDAKADYYLNPDHDHR
jgi:PleD family two-component response regulator